MHRLGTALATAALAVGLVGVAPPAMAVPACAEPDHPIRGYNHLDLAVGTTKVQTFELGAAVSKNCGITAAVAFVSSARHTYRVDLTLQPDGTAGDNDFWAGAFKLGPKDLRNSDAGTGWTVRYEVEGDNPEALDTDGQVTRATRASFNAGPEPVRKNTITFSGRLERASWNTRRYSGISRTVYLIKLEGSSSYTLLASPTTRKNGRYRVTQSFPGAGDYRMYYPGDTTTASIYSRTDAVAAP